MEIHPRSRHASRRGRISDAGVSYGGTRDPSAAPLPAVLDYPDEDEGR
jgi:hypothetical protein